MNNLNNKKITIVVVIIIIGVIGYFLYNYFGYGGMQENILEENNILLSCNEENISEKTNSSKQENTIFVHIVGEVANPGIIELKEGDRVFNAISKAGGTTKNADTSKINLAELVEDGMKIKVPNVNDKDENNENISEKEISINKTQKTEKEIKVININTATKVELETLPGIGEATALKIISYRKEKGKFSKIEDIKNVSGIGDSKFEKIKKYISVK